MNTFILNTDKMQHSEESPIFSSSYSTDFIALAAVAPLRQFAGTLNPVKQIPSNKKDYKWLILNGITAKFHTPLELSNSCLRA